MRGVLAVVLGVAITTACSVNGANAVAAYQNGNTLWEQCSGESYASKGRCSGYIIGVVDALAGFDQDSADCVPRSATVGQITDVVSKYLKEHPEDRHLSAASLVKYAVEQAFCR